VKDPEAVVIGSGPNGLAAAVCLAEAGVSVLVIEAKGEIGGGTRTEQLTLPGFHHDVCSAVHPMGILSPYFRTLPLQEHGLQWIAPPASVAHPLDDAPAVILRRSLEETAGELGSDGAAYRSLLEGFLEKPHELLRDALAPLAIPRHPLLMAKFGLRAIRSAQSLAKRFRTDQARALFAGCAGHAILPFDRAVTGALGLVFLLCAHMEDWPVALGGSKAIASSLASLFSSHGGQIKTNFPVKNMKDLPPSRLYIFDTSPAQLADIASTNLPSSYVRRLRRFRYGPGVFKIDWALSGSIPWKDKRCLLASTVHVGGTFEEIAAAEAAVWRGEHPSRPYILLAQQSEFDRTRAPEGKQTGWAYCHVPPFSTVDRTEAVEQQIERFAPGFRDLILARHVSFPSDLEKYNRNNSGGAVTGGVADLFQLYNRPVTRLNPYTTPNSKILICSASTPPGGGVHGMCGFYAAQTALKRLGLAHSLPF